MTTRTQSTLKNNLLLSTSLRRSTLMLSLAVGMVGLSAPAYAVDDLELPTGGSVVGGDATINYAAPGQLDVQQNSDRLVVDWDKFNIGRSATTTFIQPGSSSLAVNRVTGKNDNPTQILGTLKANGQVMVLDRNGVIFGRTARVDVGGIVASTGTVSAAQVMSGSNKIDITDMADATVENQGTITAADGGLAALVAPTVRNSGVINAKLGRVALAAGEAATVDLYGDNLVELQLSSEATKAVVEHTGTINAQGGSVQLTAQAAKDVVDSVVNMDGVINASSVSEKGGRIVLSADTINVRGTATANGSKGGSVNVNARSRARVESGARIEASSNQGRNAGTIEVKAGDSLHVAGTLQAHGADQTGFIDTSAADVSFAETASVTTNGEWLIDPININIGPILEALLEMQLNLFGNATVTTPAIGPQAGNIYVERQIDWNTNNRLTLNAINDILFNSAASGLNATGGGSVVLNAGRNIGLMNGSGIVTNGGDVTMNARRFRLNSGVVNANGGDIDINNTDGFQAVAGSIRTSGTGTISLNQNKDADAFLSSNTIQNAVDAVSNTGTGLNTIDVGAGTYSEDVVLNKANMVLNGANAGTAGYMARVAESVISGASTGITVTARNVTVDGVEVTGGTVGIKLAAADSAVRNSRIHNTAGAGIQSDNADRLTLQANVITQTGAQGIALGNDSDYARVVDNEVYSTGSTGILINGGSDASIVSDNRIGMHGTVNGDGILIRDAKNFGGLSTTVTGNIITGTLSPAINYGSGVHVSYSNRVVVGGTGKGDANVIYATGWDGVRFQNGENNKAVSNYISNVHRTGVFGLDVQGLLIKDNTIDGANNYYGMDINNSKNVTISGNYVNATNLEGMLLTNLYGATYVVDNDVANTGLDGIHATGTSRLYIRSNRIGVDGAIRGDGVLVEKSTNVDTYSDISGNVIANTISTGTDKGSGVQVLNSQNVRIGSFENANRISNVGWDGVRVEDAGNILVEANEISRAVRSGVYFENVTGSTVRYNDVRGMGWYGLDVRRGSDVLLEANDVSTTGREGINAEAVGGDLTIDGNYVVNTGSHGISVKSSPNVAITSNIVGGGESYIRGIGIYVNSPQNLTIGGAGAGNTVMNTLEDGIYVDAYGSGHADVIENAVKNAGYNGIMLRNLKSANVDSNSVDGAVQSGIKVAGSTYGSVALSGNEVSNADIGMTFESGLIDLTGATNKLNGGRIGYRFAPVVVKGGFSQVDLQDDTIGTTEFAGQSDFYVELLNGALFAPGTPTLEDGLNASYDGFAPSSVGGILTAAQYLALENMFFHYNDDPTVGLFFFGQVPLLQQSRVFRQDINPFVPGTGNAGFTITGLPRVPGGVGGTLPAGGAPTNPADLNNLAPAAGGGNVGTPPAGQTPEELAAIAPAAGGGQNTACWSDAANIVGAGQVANYNFNADPLSALQDANACGSNPGTL